MISYLVLCVIIAICLAVLMALNSSEDEVATLEASLETINVKDNLARPRKKITAVYPLISSPPLFIPEGDLIEEDAIIKNVLICLEYPAVPLVLSDVWIAPGTVMTVWIYKDRDGLPVHIRKN